MDARKKVATHKKLEMIKFIIEQAKASVDQNGDIEYAKYDELALSLFDNGHVDWLVERVQELEKIKDAKIALVNKGDEEKRYVEQERMIELERQNKRYREALEYIADKPIERGTWTTQGIDCVFTARKALEESE